MPHRNRWIAVSFLKFPSNRDLSPIQYIDTIFISMPSSPTKQNPRASCRSWQRCACEMSRASAEPASKQSLLEGNLDNLLVSSLYTNHSILHVTAESPIPTHHLHPQPQAPSPSPSPTHTLISIPRVQTASLSPQYTSYLLPPPSILIKSPSTPQRGNRGLWVPTPLPDNSQRTMSCVLQNQPDEILSPSHHFAKHILITAHLEKHNHIVFVSFGFFLLSLRAIPIPSTWRWPHPLHHRWMLFLECILVEPQSSCCRNFEL